LLGKIHARFVMKKPSLGADALLMREIVKMGILGTGKRAKK
jgi:hypothetical protein